MEKEKSTDLSERIARLMKWTHYQISNPDRSLEEKSTLREVAKWLMEIFPEFHVYTKKDIGL